MPTTKVVYTADFKSAVGLQHHLEMETRYWGSKRPSLTFIRYKDKVLNGFRVVVETLDNGTERRIIELFEDTPWEFAQ